MKPAPRYNQRAGVLLLCLTGLLLNACRKDLCYNHFRQADISIDWEYAWERDYGRNWGSDWDEETYGGTYASLLPGKPEGVTAWIYDSDGQSNQRFLSPDGGTAVLSEGAHDFLFYNNDTEYIIFNFEDEAVASQPEQAKATTSTRTRSTLKMMHEGERTVSPPDVLYGAFVQGVPGIDLHESVPVSVTMRPLVYTYVIRYEFAEGLEHVALARGALAGMAESVYLRDGSTSDETVTILFDCELTSWGVQAVVKSFGVPGFPDKYYTKNAENEGEERNYMLNLEVRLQNGKIIDLDPFDITEQMKQQPRGGLITVSHVVIPEGEAGFDSGFLVNVEDWDENTDIIDLPIGI